MAAAAATAGAGVASAGLGEPACCGGPPCTIFDGVCGVCGV